MPECEACKNGIGEPWEKFVESLHDAPPRLLTKAFVTWRKRVIDYYLAGCKKHQEEASDRMDYITVLRSGHLFQTGKMTPTQWIEGRRKLREEYHADVGSKDES